MKARLPVVALGVCTLLSVAGLRADSHLAAPESAGFSADGLKTLQQTMRALVDEGKLANITTLVARHGKVVYLDAYGVQDLATKRPVRSDTIFRLASMTKPIVGVAMMMLWEQGKWTLDDPVAKHIPEFAGLKVSTPAGEVPQATPMTMRQLMSHSAGFDVNAGYAKLRLPERDKPLQAFIDRLAKLPLAAQPGTDWRYGPSVDIQGYLVEKLSGQPLDAFLRTKIFEPLGMKDTGFSVETSKLDRVSSVFTYSADKHLIKAPEDAQRSPGVKPAFLSGSGGLFSTTDDYYRFAQMVLNGGEANGKRFLKESTVKLMRTNVLADGVAVDTYGPPQPGLGFGLDFAIVLDPAAAKTPEAKGSFYWGGAFGTWFWLDPVNDIVVVGMIQNVNGSQPTGGSPQVRPLSRKLVYQALVDPKSGQSKPFDAHDLSGFWDLTNSGLPRGALNETSNNRPPMTPWGLEKFRKTKTGAANALTTGAHANEKEWNDPIRWCDPTGFPRIMWSPTPAGMRFGQTNEEVIQFFQNNRVWRDIWTDGRKLPDADADSRWYGYAVGRWEGDTFVVNSNNFDEATWLDQYGSPHSDQMTVEERYRRVDHDHLEMTLNITDPKAYLGTWKGDKKIFQLVEKPTRSAFNDFPEDICVWSETKRPVLQ